MARDWSFAPASFRGATFYVNEGGPPGGRRKVIHEYPGSERWDVEDLGTKAKKVTLTAYLVSETADTDYAALVAAFDQTGPGQLIIPFFGVVQASAETWDPHWTQERLQYVGVDVTFVVENPAGAPVAVGLGVRIMAGQLAAASSIIGGAITALFAGTMATSYQRSDAAPALADTAAFVETMRQATVLPDATATAARQALALLDPALAVESDPGAFVAAALGVLDDIVVDADADEAAPSFQAAAALATAMVPATLVGQPDPAQAAASVPAALAVATTMQAIRLTASASYADRPGAIAARTAIETLAAGALPFVGALGPVATEAFSDLWGQGATYLSTAIANLAPILLFQTNCSIPSTALAYRLYADPTRASDLVARNGVTTPLLMPTLFEAASR